MSGINRDYFGTFLQTLSGTSTGVDRAVEPSREDLRDAAMRTLAAHGGKASMADLLAPPLTTLGVLFPVLEELQRFALAKIDGATVMLTDEGKNVALKLGARPSPPA